ncbi:MAG TPA: glycosyltransferase [Prosthecobacter sp.]|nr:glycosyltransferase [Prosthecobacter sp.]
MDSFAKWNPTWEPCFWTDEGCEALLREELPDFLPSYLAYPPGILRADIFRIAVLYLRGGVYADLDMGCLRPLDELLERLDGDGKWDVLLARDHPCHEKAHYGGRMMWLNAFMLAKPGARYLRHVLDAFTRQLQSGYDAEDAVQATGPGLLTTVIELGRSDLQALGIREIPWRWVHPLPNVMGACYPERPHYKRLIRTRQWLEGQRVRQDEDSADFTPYGEPPFAAHYWWHSYIENCRQLNMLVRYGERLLQSDGEIVERRLGALSEAECPQSLGEALCQLAERGGRRIVLHGAKLPEAILNTVQRAGAGLDWRVVAGRVAIDADLRIQDKPLEEALQTPDAGKGLAARGMLLILPGGRDCEPQHASGLEGLRSISRLALWERIPAAGEEVPAIFHWFEGGKMNGWQSAALQSWKYLHPNGWRFETWSQSRLADLVAEKEPELLATFYDYPTVEHRLLAGRWIVLKHFGGVVASPDLACLRNMTDLLRWKRLVISTELDAAKTRRASGEWVASIPSHPFWNGLATHLETARFRALSEAVGAGFLNERCQAAAALLKRDDWPNLHDQWLIGARPQGTEWLRLVHARNWQALATLMPEAAALSMRECLESRHRGKMKNRPLSSVEIP